MKRALLTPAYAQARYRVLVADKVVALRVGCRATALEAGLPSVSRFALVTAANPGIRTLSGATNLERDLALLDALRHYLARRLPAENAAPDGSHREPSWLVCDLALPVIDRLARDFGQAAVLAWRRGEPVALRWYLDD